uniref:F-box domain-containing protein n=3 Tax=Parascaris univalens TaxID=6257 RepID=A0A914ZVP7_PARUN
MGMERRESLDEDSLTVHLPNEMVCHIWQFATRNTLLNCRAVSRAWKVMIEKQPYQKKRFAWLQISVHRYKWFLRGGSSTRYWELPADVKSLRMALSLVELYNPFKEGGMLCIDSSAIIRPVLDVIEEQQWSIHDLQISGHLTFLRVAVIKSFARRVGAKWLIVDGHRYSCN